MKAAEVTDAAIEAIGAGRYDFVRLNYANGDMVGHTGHYEATVLAVEAIDLCLARLVRACEAAGAALVVTADHGNADDMYERGKDGRFQVDERGRPRPRTSHSLNPVPLVVHDPHAGARFRIAREVEAPGLANLAATLLALMGFQPPADYAPSVVTPV